MQSFRDYYLRFLIRQSQKGNVRKMNAVLYLQVIGWIISLFCLFSLVLPNITSLIFDIWGKGREGINIQDLFLLPIKDIFISGPMADYQEQYYSFFEVSLNGWKSNTLLLLENGGRMTAANLNEKDMQR